VDGHARANARGAGGVAQVTPLARVDRGGGLAEDGYAAEWAESVLLPRAYCQPLINMLTLAAPPDVPIEAKATGP
jgi:hypothetical protein